MEKMLSLARAALQEALASGADVAEVVAERGGAQGVDLERNKILSIENHRGEGISFRCFARGGVGRTGTSGLDKNTSLEMARLAAKMALSADADPDFKGLPEASEVPKVEGLYDPKVEATSIEEIVAWAMKGIEEALKVDSNMICSGGVSTSWSEGCLLNSNGLERTWQGSQVNGSIFAILKRGSDVGSFFEFDGGRRLDQFCADGIGRRAAEGALQFLGAEDVPTAVWPVVLGPLASGSIVSGIAGAASAEEIQRNRSFLAGHKGKRIASECVTIVDNPLIPGGLSSSAFDGEGYPRSAYTLVDKGVLSLIYHSSYTAGKAGEKNTGHGTRGGVSAANPCLVLGQKSSAELISEIEEGLYIPVGGVSPDTATGDFSATVDFGFKIENGRLARPVKNAMLGGRFMDLLSKIDGISKDYREEPGMVMPWVRISAVQVSGRS